jgi:L-histidine N-alpha-methyltransferase
MFTYPIAAAPISKRASQKYRNTFYRDVVIGLMATPKHLDSKYFYDAMGDELFRQIMSCPEYYPTDCEMEILSRQAKEIVASIRSHTGDFDLVELGAGDATKTIHLLRELQGEGLDFTYYPIDISRNVIRSLEQSIPEQLPALNMVGLNGEYFEMLQEVTELSRLSQRNKVVLFMGANIGNFDPAAALLFCQSIREQLNPGDLLIVGFDLRKNPATILSAYNDAGGITRAFNLNLLTRINNELGADFNVAQFEHYPTYDPLTGSCKSYLISLEKQTVHFGGETCVDFQENEPVLMEISHKYSLEETEQMALQAGFTPVGQFLDRKHWFADCMWKCQSAMG